MMKLSLLILLGLSFVLGCHKSCVCNSGSNQCISCNDKNSSMDSFMLSCPCSQGYYSTYDQNNKFYCKKSLVANSIIDSCTQEAAIKTKNIIVNTHCDSITDPTSNEITIVSQVDLDFSGASLNDSCQSQYQTKLQYFNIITQKYEDLPLKYITEQTKGSKYISIPINDFYAMTSQGTVNTATVFSNILQLKTIISQSGYVLRNHVYKLVLFTNSQKITTFAFDVTQQESSSCDDSSIVDECAVITDINTVGYLCTDDYCTAQLNTPKYIVGDYLYAKITFAANSYKKKLLLNSVLLQAENYQIYDLTAFVKVVQINNGIILSFPLSIPCTTGLIQVTTTIDSNSRLRSLVQTTSLQNPKQNFSIEVQEKNNSTPIQGSDNAGQTNSAAKSYSVMISSMISLVGLLLVL